MYSQNLAPRCVSLARPHKVSDWTDLWRIAKAALFLVFLLGSDVYADSGSQKFVLQRGWNLITFQVLPQNKTPESVFGALTSDSGSVLYSPDSAVNKLRAVYTARYDGATLRWEKFTVAMPANFPSATSNPQPPPIDPSTTTTITQIEFGLGYYIFLENLLANSAYTITGQQSPAGSGISLESGWNLLGVTGNFPELQPSSGPAQPSQKISVLSIFKQADLDKITAVVRWNARGGRYQYYYPREPERSEFQFLEPNSAHWVQTNAALVVKPDLVVQAPGDADFPPLSESPLQDNQPWNPGPEDTSIRLPNTSPVYHSQETQEFLLAVKGQSVIKLPLSNKGGGILGWKASLRPYTKPAPAPSVPLLTPADVKLVLSLKRDHGITTSEPDAIEVIVDHSHLAPGTYLAQLEVAGDTGQGKEFTLIIDAGGLDGQWKGTATIDTVNGKQNPVADIDLYIHLFKDKVPGSGQIRGIIDGQETLLWPMDAQLMGHIADSPSPSGVDSNYSSRFVISGGYTLPPGDVNRFPFDSKHFPDPGASPAPQQATDPDTGLRYLTNSDGDRFYLDLADPATQNEPSINAKRRPNFANPLNRFISREVELTGQMSGTDISQGGADVLTGEYNETITGLLAQPLELRGHFRLVRKGYTPLERRPLKRFYVTPGGGRRINASDSFGALQDERITVDSHLLIHRVVVVVAHDIPDVKHTLTLTGPGPNPKTVTLHSRQVVGKAQYVIYDSGDLPLNALGLLDPPEIQPNGARPLPTATSAGLDVLRYEADLRNSLANYAVRKPRESLTDAFSGSDAFGDWRLRLVNNDSAPHNLLGWSLLVYGVPSFTVEGDVVVDGSDDPDRFNDVEIRVQGLNATLGSALTNFNKATGHFAISHLPGIRVNIVATKPGYPTASIDGLNTPNDPRGYRDGLTGITPGDKTLIPSARPVRGFTITLKQPPAGPVGMLPNALILSGEPDLSPQPRALGAVNAYPRLLNVSSAGGQVTAGDLHLVYAGPLPAGVTESQIRWQFEGESVSGITTLPATVTGRSPTVRLTIPESSFTGVNNYMLALRPKAILGSTSREVKFDDWVVFVLMNPPAGSVSRVILAQGSMLSGCGAFPEDPNRGPLQAQKTDVAKVDVDRPPLIDPASNPTLNFAADGLAEPGGGEGEDTDLHPRAFLIHPVNQNGNRFAYAEIVASPDGIYTRLVPPATGASPAYDDRNQPLPITGRDINAPSEPVRIFTAIGDRVIDRCSSVTVGGQAANQCGSATDGRIRIFAGSTPGTSVRPPGH